MCERQRQVRETRAARAIIARAQDCHRGADRRRFCRGDLIWHCASAAAASMISRNVWPQSRRRCTALTGARIVRTRKRCLRRRSSTSRTSSAACPAPARGPAVQGCRNKAFPYLAICRRRAPGRHTFAANAGCQDRMQPAMMLPATPRFTRRALRFIALLAFAVRWFRRCRSIITMAPLRLPTVISEKISIATS